MQRAVRTGRVAGKSTFANSTNVRDAANTFEPGPDWNLVGIGDIGEPDSRRLKRPVRRAVPRQVSQLLHVSNHDGQALNCSEPGSTLPPVWLDQGSLQMVQVGSGSRLQDKSNHCMLTALHHDRSQITAPLPPAPARSSHQILSDGT